MACFIVIKILNIERILLCWGNCNGVIRLERVKYLFQSACHKFLDPELETGSNRLVCPYEVTP